jgi:hypothetical protein
MGQDYNKGTLSYEIRRFGTKLRQTVTEPSSRQADLLATSELLWIVVRGPPSTRCHRFRGYGYAGDMAAVDVAAVTALAMCSTSACVRCGCIGSDNCRRARCTATGQSSEELEKAGVRGSGCS